MLCLCYFHLPVALPWPQLFHSMQCNASLGKRACPLFLSLPTQRPVLVPRSVLTTLRQPAEYGQCGVGAYCLGGCDPRMSFSLDSCVPDPVCQDKTYKMDSLDGVIDVGKYLGDASKADWVSQGEPLLYKGNVLLTMPKESVGTVLATTDYIWYGNIKGRVKTSHGAGVVTAFILLSDVKDEIDYEWVGTELEIAQTNYYFQGIPSCKSQNAPHASIHSSPCLRSWLHSCC